MSSKTLPFEQKPNPEEQARIKEVVRKAREAEGPRKEFDPTPKAKGLYKTCAECGREFIPTHGNQKRCIPCRDGRSLKVAKAVEDTQTKKAETYPPANFAGYSISYDEPVPRSKTRSQGSLWVPFLKEFLASSAETACIEMKSGKEADKAREAVRKQIIKHGMEGQVVARKRGESLYLIKSTSEYWNS